MAVGQMQTLHSPGASYIKHLTVGVGCVIFGSYIRYNHIIELKPFCQVCRGEQKPQAVLPVSIYNRSSKFLFEFSHGGAKLEKYHDLLNSCRGNGFKPGKTHWRTRRRNSRH